MDQGWSKASWETLSAAVWLNVGHTDKKPEEEF